MSITTPRPWLGSYAEGVPHDIEPETGSLYDLVRGVWSGRRDRYKAYTDRAKQDFTAWLAPSPVPA